MVIRPSRIGLAVSFFALMTVTVIEPPRFDKFLPPRFAFDRARARPSMTPPSTHLAFRNPSIAPTSPEKPPISPQPSFAWESPSRTEPGILERLRADAGRGVQAEDFVGPGPFDAAWKFLTGSEPRGAPWFRAKVRQASPWQGDGLAVQFFLTWDESRFAVSLLSQAGSPLALSGVDVQLFEYPLKVADNVVLVSPEVGVWSSPDEKGAPWGALWQLNLEVALDDHFGVWIDGRGKTDAGVPQAGRTADWDLQTGVHWVL
jgi:hypothetical protein